MERQEEEQLKEAEKVELKVSPSVGIGSSVGTILQDRYRLDSLLGSGGTSSVYKGFDLRDSREIAVKLMHAHLVSDVMVVRRFEQEAKTANVLVHPNIVPIHDFGSTPNGQPYLVMDFVAGRNLQDLMKESGGSLEWRRAVAICIQTCAALLAAHGRGVVHRDVKPTNIMISHNSSSEDVVKVLDFGIAKVLPIEGQTFFKLTQSGEMLGSLLYMSPEQCQDHNVDERSDVYALGCVLYETVTGMPPLSGKTAFETMNKHVGDMPERLHRVRPTVEFPDGLERIIFKAIAKKPEDRYQSIGDLQDDLVALMDGKAVNAPVSADDDGVPVEFTKNVVGVFGIYVAFLVLFTGMALFAGSAGGLNLEPSTAIYFAFLVTSPLPAYVLWSKFIRKKK